MFLSLLAYQFGASEIQAVDQTRQRCELLPKTKPPCRTSMHCGVTKLQEKIKTDAFAKVVIVKNDSKILLRK